MRTKAKLLAFIAVGMAALGLVGCRNHMPHAFTWPGGGDITYTHAKPPEGGYHSNWDPFAVSIELTPVEDVNPVRTQHLLIATVRDKEGKGLPNRRVEWIIGEGGVGDIVEVDESGWRNSRGYKVTNHYAVSHTNNFSHTLDMGTDDPSDDVKLEPGQTWCVITSPVEGDTHIIAYAPGIYDWNKHKVFATKHWYDVNWSFPPPATNPIGTTHDFTTMVTKYSDGTGLQDYTVTYRIVDGPAAVFEPGGSNTVTVKTDASGAAKVTLKQTTPAEGTNNISIDVWRPENAACCKPAVHIATGQTAKTWIGPKIACNKAAPASVTAGQQLEYVITVSNPSQVDTQDVVVTDTLPDGMAYVSSTPAANANGQSLSWSLGSIPPNGQKVITIVATATRTGKFENCAEVKAGFGLSTRCCASTVVTSPKLTLEKKCPAAVTVCDPIDYVIIVRNAGDGPAKNVKVTDDLPEGLTTADGKRSITANVGDLGPGQAKEVSFKVSASRPGRYENKAVATADGGLTAEASCTTVVSKPELEVTKTGPEMRFVGREFKYDITVTNKGDSAARDTVLVDAIPAGATFVSADNNGRMEGGRVTWSLGTIEPGASRQVSLTLKSTERGIVKNTATAKAFCTEATASASTKIEGIAAILLEVEDLDDPIEIGTGTTYRIVVTNQGSTDGTNIALTCTLPVEEQYVSSEGPTQASVDGQVVKFAPLPSLAPKAKATYLVKIKALKPGDVRFRVSMKSDQITTTVDETESTNLYE